MTKFDPILSPRPNQSKAALPINEGMRWAVEYMERQNARFWDVHIISLDQDRYDWEKLDEGTRYFLSNVLAFFATSDSLVGEFDHDLKSYVQPKEVGWVYTAFENIEVIHARMYAIFIEELISDPKEQARLLNSVENFPTVAEKYNWGKKWLSDETATFGQKVVACAIMEGLMFASSFVAIDNLSSKGGIMPGLIQGNQYVFRDETEHAMFACHLHRHLLPENQCSPELIKEMMADAVRIERNFVEECLPVKLIGMNSEFMVEYVEYCAGNLLTVLGVEHDYPTTTRLAHLVDNLRGTEAKANQFEVRSTGYGLADRNTKVEDIDGDF